MFEPGLKTSNSKTTHNHHRPHLAKVKSSLSREGVLTITAPRGNPVAAQSYTQTLENKMDKVGLATKFFMLMMMMVAARNESMDVVT